MERINVEKKSETLFLVTVNAGTKTEHRVTLSESYYQRLCSGNISKEALIKKSFEFLLERESNTSILRSFELPVIAHYFLEFETTIGEYF